MGNFSRQTFDRLKRYVGVRLQQGVPIVDADWNELQDIRKDELEAFLKHFVGNGVPDADSFLIRDVGEADDFSIGDGHCLVDGWDVFNDWEQEHGEPLRYQSQTLYDNDDLADQWDVSPLDPLIPDTWNPQMIYLDVWEREVDSGEDDAIVNPDIGIETSVRTKREWVVRVAERREGPEELPTPPEGHVFYPLAGFYWSLEGNPTIETLTDLRRTRLDLASLRGEVDGKVDRAGDRITGTMEVDGHLEVDASSGSAITADAASDVSVNKIGVEATASGSAGLKHGLYAVAAGSDTNDSADDKYGVYGLASGRGGDKYGVYGSASGYGGNKTGLYGTASGTGFYTYGVQAHASGDGGAKWGLYSHTTGTGGGQYGVLTIAEGDHTYVKYGVDAHARGVGGDKYGVRSHASGEGGTNYGVHTTASSFDAADKFGVYADVIGDGDKCGYYSKIFSEGGVKYGFRCYTRGGGGDNYGLDIYNHGDDAASTKYGVYANVTGAGGEKFGVRTHAHGNGGNKYGFWAKADGDDTDEKYAVYATAAGEGGTKYGIYATASGSGTNWAGVFDGDVDVTGNLTKGSGTFLIDHVLDPENKVLRHSFVESPEDLCVYRGRVTLDRSGQAGVDMPDYFSALTREEEATVLLTPIGEKPCLLGYTWQKEHTRLAIHGEAGVEVSYLVLADRDDPVIRLLRKPVEEDKTAAGYDKGRLLYPEAFGQPPVRKARPGVSPLPAPPEEPVAAAPAEAEELRALEADRQELRKKREAAEAIEQKMIERVRAKTKTNEEE